jgi:hypothetical protein
MISKSIDKAIDVINKRLADIKVDAIIVRNTETYNVLTGRNTTTSTEESITGFIGSFEYSEVDNVKVLQEDIKFLILSTFEIPFNSVTDQIKVDSLTYNIVSVKKVRVGSKNVLYTLQLRI